MRGASPFFESERLGAGASPPCTKLEIERSARMARRAGVIGIVQMRSVLDKDVNFALARRLVQEAAARQADLVCLPENFDYIGVGGEPEPLTGPTVLRYQALSRELKVWISLGGMHEHVADKTPSLANTHVIIDAQGVVRACYRKVHLCTIPWRVGAALVRARG